MIKLGSDIVRISYSSVDKIAPTLKPSLRQAKQEAQKIQVDDASTKVSKKNSGRMIQFGTFVMQDPKLKQMTKIDSSKNLSNAQQLFDSLGLYNYRS
jgi:hypothetical protein